MIGNILPHPNYFMEIALSTVMFSSRGNEDELMEQNGISEEEDAFERETSDELTKTTVVDFIQEH